SSSESSARLRFPGSASRSFLPGKSEVSILNPTKRGRTFIRSHSRECSSGAHMFTLQTAACIAIANRSAPITSPTTSSENGEIAAARHAITFFSVRCFSEKCEWARISQTLARVRPHQRNLPPPPEARVLQVHMQLKTRRLRPVHQQRHLR